MAIMIEQEERQTNWTFVIGSIVFVVILFVGLYYLFFKSPGTIEGVVSGSQQQLVTIANTKFDYKPILDQLGVYSNNFSAPIPPTSLGRPNPFQPQ